METASVARPQAPAVTRALLARGLVRVVRPYAMLWFEILPVTTIAIWLQAGDVAPKRLAFALGALVLADAGLTVFNDISDRDTDQLSSEAERHTRPMVMATVPLRVAYVQVALLLSVGLTFAFLGSLWFGLLLTLGVVYCLAYSARSVRLSGRPFISQLFWVILWPAIYLGVYLVVGGDLARGLPYLAGTIVFVGIAETLAKDLRDFDNDRAAGKRTTTVKVGVRTSSRASVVAFIVGALIYASAPLIVHPTNPRLAVALAIVLGLWCGRAWQLAAELGQSYSKPTARALQVGAIRVFITVNVLYIAGLFA